MPKELNQVGIDFFTSANYRKVQQVDIAQPPDAVFAAFAKDPAGWGSWFPGFSSAGRYLSATPPGPGSQREMVMRGMKMVETVIAWDEPTRFAYYVSRATMPGVRAFAEDYRIEPDGENSRLIWTIALDLGPAVKPLGAVIGGLGGSAVRQAAANLERHLSSSPPAGERPSDAS